MRFIMTSGGLPQRSAMAYVIKRYSNRKLYDTQESRYVTLEEIEEMIRAGKEISVVDAASGEDLTAVTLTQIILENERNHRGGLPIGFLHQLIKHGEAWQDFLQRSMKSSLEGIVSNQREMERVFQEWMSRAGWGTMMPGAGLGARAEAKRDGGEPDAERLRSRAERALAQFCAYMSFSFETTAVYVSWMLLLACSPEVPSRSADRVTAWACPSRILNAFCALSTPSASAFW